MVGGGNGSCHCDTVQCHSILHLKRVKMLNFMLCTLHHRVMEAHGDTWKDTEIYKKEKYSPTQNPDSFR